MRLGLAAIAAITVLSTAPVVTGQRLAAPVQGVRVVATYPHDTTAFTQGLVYADGELFESTGLRGESSLHRGQPAITALGSER